MWGVYGLQTESKQNPNRNPDKNQTYPLIILTFPNVEGGASTNKKMVLQSLEKIVSEMMRKFSN